jgi:mRNA-degrading endonuclease YafQ of YafQ-DinJ toxin-antitoxin module
LPDLDIPPSFRKRLGKKTVSMQGSILECLTRLADNPKHPGLHTHKMKGTRDDVWEAYVDQANRVTFHWSGDVIVLRNHCNHDILRRP